MWEHLTEPMHVAARTIAIVALCATGVLSEPQHYEETVDFSNQEASATLLSPALGLGVNTITGSAAPAFGLSQDLDFFEVDVPAGLLLTEISIAVTNYTPDGSDLGTFSLIPTTQGGTAVTNNGTVQIVFSLIDTGSVTFQIASPVDIKTLTFGSFDYIVSLKVEEDLPLLTIDRDGTLSWNAESGTVYQVQWSDTLATNGWSDFGGTVTAVTDTVSITNDISDVTHRFYRLTDPSTR